MCQDMTCCTSEGEKSSTTMSYRCRTAGQTVQAQTWLRPHLSLGFIPMDVEEIVSSLSEGICPDSLNAVTKCVQRWIESPLTPPLPLLLALRQTFSLVKRGLANQPQDLPIEPEPSQQPKKRGRAAKTRHTQPMAEGAQSESIYEETIAFIKVFGQAMKLRLFNDVGSMELIVGQMVQFLILECGMPGATASKNGTPTPLTKACFDVFKSMLLLSEREATEPQNSSDTQAASSDSAGGALGTNQPKYYAIVLPSLVPLMSVKYASVITPCMLHLRACTLDFFTRYFQNNIAQQDKLMRLLIQIGLTVTPKFRTESRRLACEAFVKLFACFTPGGDDALAQACVDFVLGMSRAKEDRTRLFATETSAALLSAAYNAKAPFDLPSEAAFALLGVLLLRANDRYPVARRGALTSLASLMERIAESEPLRTVFGQFLHQPPATAALPQQPDKPDEDAPDIKTQRDLLVATVMCRLKEDKAWVRRSSIQVLEMIIVADEIPVDIDQVFANVIEMSQLHVEESVLVRKQALSCLVSTCRQQIQKYTSAAAPVNEATLANDMDLPARIISNALLQAFARDNDDGLKNFASGAVSELLFAPLESRKDKRLPCVWEILSRFSHEHLQLLARVSALLSKQHLIKPSVVKTLQAEIRAGTRSRGAFELLANLSGNAAGPLDADLILECYEQKKSMLTAGVAAEVEDFANILKLMAQLALPTEQAEPIVSELLQALTQVKPYHTLMPPMLRLVVALSPSRKAAKEHLQELLRECQAKLQEFCRTRSIPGVELPKLGITATKFILLIGDLALLRDDTEAQRPMVKVAHQVETYLQAIIQATVAQEPASSDPGSPPSTLGPVTPFRSLSGSSGTPGWTRTPGPRTIDPDLSQYSLLSLSQMSQVSCATARDFGEGGPIPAPLMSAALLTFGRLCLVSEQLAKKYIAVFVNQLRKSSHEIIKANILAILADLCVEYSGSVDKFVPVMSWCMGDKSVLVRHTAIVLLTQLLAEGFIKWKNNLFFSFLVAVADDHRIVAHFAESALVKVLLPKHPNLFFNHFMESIFVLAGYQGHPVYNNHRTPLHESVYARANEAGAPKRHALYRLLLRHLSPVHLYKLHQKLHTELLALCTEEGAADGDFGAGAHLAVGSVSINALSPPGAYVMLDTFAILQCREMRLSTRAPVSEEEEEGGTEALNELTRRVYAEMFQKHIEHSVIPVIIDLKRWLRKHKSPYIRQLEEYLQMLMREYKNELQNMLAADPQLAVELQYDLNRRPQNGPMAPPPPVGRRLSTGRPCDTPSGPGGGPSATPASGGAGAMTPLSASTPPTVRRLSGGGVRRLSSGPGGAAQSGPIDTSRSICAELEAADDSPSAKRRRTCA